MTMRRRRNWLKYLGIFVLVVVIVGGGFLIWKNLQPENDEGDSGSQVADMKTTVEKDKEIEDKDKAQGDEAKDGKVEEQKADVGKEKVEQFDGEDPNKGEGLTGVVTYAGVNGGSLMVRVNIDQYLEAGTCKLKLMRNGSVIHEETAEVMGSAATATCKGFNVPVAKLGSGKINVVVLVTSGEKTGTIESEVNL